MSILSPPTAPFKAVTGSQVPGLIGTIGAKVIDQAGSVVLARRTSGIQEITLSADWSIYVCSFSAAPTPIGKYLVVWDTAGAHPEFAMEELEVSTSAVGQDPLANPVPGSYEPGSAGYNLALLGTQVIKVIAPEHQLGDKIEIIIGDDYNVADARIYEWENPDWPDLSAASAVVVRVQAVPKQSNGKITTFTASVPLPRKVRLELTHDQTVKLKKSKYAYSIVATFSGRTRTILTGPAFVKGQP